MGLFVPMTTIPVIIVRKIEDTSRASTTTTTADPELLSAVEADSTYEFVFRLLVQGDTGASEWKGGPYGPAGYSAVWSFLARTTAGAGQPNSVYTRVLAAGDTANTFCDHTNDCWAELKGTLVTDSTPGDFGVTWAQNASTTNATKTLIGSMLRLEKVA